MNTKEKIKSLWRLCFDDSEEFIEMYFQLRYKNEINIAVSSGDEMISALQMIPYPMSCCGKMVSTSYISGACTHPEFREKGAMKQLLSQAFSEMLKSEVLFSTLIPAEPWLFDYYAHMGYAPVFHYSTKTITLPEFIPSKEINVCTVSEYQEEIYQYLNKKLSERPCCIQHTSDDFQVIMTDLTISSGTLLVARQENEICGLAVIYKRNEHIIINELLAETKDAEYSLLYAIKEHTEQNQMIQILPPTPEPEQPQQSQTFPQQTLGMARIINAKEVLQLYASAFPEEEMQIELLDKQLSVNNGYYYVCKGKCMYSTERLPGAHIQMNISELTNRILLPLQPYMSLMMN